MRRSAVPHLVGTLVGTNEAEGRAAQLGIGLSTELCRSAALYRRPHYFCAHLIPQKSVQEGHNEVGPARRSDASDTYVYEDWGVNVMTGTQGDEMGNT